MPLDAFQITDSTDDASPVIVGSTYPAMQSVVVDTAAIGDYVDKNGRPAANDAAVSVRIPNGDANAVISAGAEITVAEFALVEILTGVSGGPSLDVASLTGGFMYLPAENPVNHIFAMNGQTLTGGVATYPEIAAKWPAWVSGVNLVLPDWRGRAMMATGALGITGAVGATYNDATSVNGLTATLRTRSTAGGNAFNEAVAAFTNTANLNQQGSVINQMSGDAETRPNAVGLVLCVIAGRLKVTSVDAPLPESMHITSTSGNQTGNGFTTNGVYRSNNTGPLNGTGLGNWTWRVKATRIGDWIQHMYWNDTANIAFRESFDGGATWTSWAA